MALRNGESCKKSELTLNAIERILGIKTVMRISMTRSETLDGLLAINARDIWQIYGLKTLA